MTESLSSNVNRLSQSGDCSVNMLERLLCNVIYMRNHPHARYGMEVLASLVNVALFSGHTLFCLGLLLTQGYLLLHNAVGGVQ